MLSANELRNIDPNEVVVEFMSQRIQFGFGGLLSFTSGDEYEMVRGRIVETRYKLKDGYKLTCVPDDPSFATQHFYQMDFMTNVDEGHARILPKFIDYGIGT